MRDSTKPNPGERSPDQSAAGGRSPGSRRRTLTWILFGAVLPLTWLAYRYSGAHLVVETRPPEAVVRLNGTAVGKTPLRMLIEPDRYLLEVEHPEFEVISETVDAIRGADIVRQLQLQVGRGKLRLLSNPRGAWVEVDGQRLPEVTPTEATVDSGERRISMGLPERRTVEQLLRLESGAEREVNLDLEVEPHGSLTLRLSPGDARVILPELDLNYVAGIRLPVGEYLLRISRVGYVSRDIRYTIRSGDNQPRVDLQRARGGLQVDTTPGDAQVTVSYHDESGRQRTLDYRPDLQLPVGPVEVRASRMGLRSAYRRLNLTEGTRRVSLTLSGAGFKPGERIEDPLQIGGHGPVMLVLPPGEFTMGSDAGPPSLQPARHIRLTQPVAMSMTEIRIGDYRLFETTTGRGSDRRLNGVREDEPVRYVDWNDAVAYADWLSTQTGARYRLPSEAEWEYAARAGSPGDYGFGDDSAQLCRFANLADQSTHKVFRDWEVAECDDGFPKLAPVGQFQPNAFGLYDMHGNVAEWVLECGMPGYAGAPLDGRPADDGRGCQSHGFRGGSWDGQPHALRSAQRGANSGPGDDRGIRLLREL
ncbi:MAG: SUMF1/EgtB/PvdO family nonheme iron enzyme [Pseudomonadales bacterium]